MSNGAARSGFKKVMSVKLKKYSRNYNTFIIIACVVWSGQYFIPTPILSIDADLQLMPGHYPHSQVKDRDEATTVTRGSTLQLLMAGRITWLLHNACDPRFLRFSSLQRHVCGTGWCPHSRVWASLQYPCKRHDPGSRCCIGELSSLAKPLGVAVNHVHARI